MLAFMVTLCGAAEPPNYSVDDFNLGPVPPKHDLRTMLRKHIVRRSCEMLNAAAEKRENAFRKDNWQSWRDEIRRKALAPLGEMKFGPNGPPLNIRAVSRFERDGYTIENVLFESLPGWDVNASVYLPDPKAFPAPWRAIVIPVGHSSKQGADYQVPPRIFARCGYLALTFDPPGMAGEKQGGNDHFSDGVRCYLTGHSSNRYFVIDALRCIDYLATRRDVDMSGGVGMTGVSGGGSTTMFATLLDDRIRASGPSCCAVPNARHPVLDVYAPCTETLAPRRFADGYDDVDLLAAAIPTPVLLMAGAKDEVFKGAWSDEIAETVRQCFLRADQKDRFAYFSDPGGHGYTVAMAIEFAKWMDKWVRNTPGRTLPVSTTDDFPLDPPEMLICRPRLDRNIFTVNRDMALDLSKRRTTLSISEAAKRVANAKKPGRAPGVRRGERTLIWFHYLEEMILETDTDIELTATFVYPARDNWRGAAILYFDDRGRWTDLRRHGMLAKITAFTDKKTNGPAILTVDLRGWGDTQSADMPYDVAGWADRSRWMAYVSAALGDPVLAMRIRDGLSALAYLRTRNEVDPARVIIGGKGMGAVVALHVAAIDGHTAGAFAMEGLAAFLELAASDQYEWSHEDFLSDVLQFYDLPDLVKSIEAPVLIANPLDARKKPLEKETAAALYPPTDTVRVEARLDAGAMESRVVEFVRQILDK